MEDDEEENTDDPDDEHVSIPEGVHNSVNYHAKELQTIMASEKHGETFLEGFAALVQTSINAMQNTTVQTKNLH